MKLSSSMMVLALSLLTGTSQAETTLPIPALHATVQKIDLNHASLDELTHSVKGIGKKRAEAIIQYRQQHGNFKSLNDLAAVRGFGQRFVHQHLTELQAIFVY